MEIVLLSQIVASILAPALPFLMKESDKAAEEAGKKLGSEAWEAAKTIWAKLGTKIKEKPNLMGAAEETAKSPNDKDTQEILMLQIKKLLSEEVNASLTEDLSRFIESAKTQRVLAENGAIARNILQFKSGKGDGRQEVIVRNYATAENIKQIHKQMHDD